MKSNKPNDFDHFYKLYKGREDLTDQVGLLRSSHSDQLLVDLS